MVFCNIIAYVVWCVLLLLCLLNCSGWLFVFVVVDDDVNHVGWSLRGWF